MSYAPREATPVWLPHNIEAEQGLLGALMVDNRALEAVDMFLKAEHFFQPAHQRLYAAIISLGERGMSATPVTLRNYFERDKGLEAAGGADYLAELAANVITVINAADYGRTIFDLHLRREVIGVAEQAAEKARAVTLENSGRAVIEGLEEDLFALADAGGAGRAAVTMQEGLSATIKLIGQLQSGAIRPIKSGIKALDDKLGGFWGGDLVIVGSRPSMGKTTLAVSFATNVAEQKKRVLVFSLEMPFTQIIQKLLARKTGYATGHQTREGSFEASDFQVIEYGRHALQNLPLSIDDTAALSLAQIRARARRHKRRHGLDLIVIDYLQIMTKSARLHNTADQIGEITQGLKKIAKDFNIPVILLSQLNRAVESRDDKRPNLADLRDSGAIEADADVVLFLHREEYYLERSEPLRKPKQGESDYHDALIEHEERLTAARGKADIIIAKARMGKIGTVRCRFEGKDQYFADLESHSSYSALNTKKEPAYEIPVI